MSGTVPNNVNVYQDSSNQVLVTEPPAANVNIYQDTPSQVLISEDTPNLVVVRSGSGGSSNTRRHTHSQSTASAQWTITHTLGGKPSVTIVDSAGTVVIGEVQYNSNTQISVYFSSSFSGYAYLT